MNAALLKEQLESERLRADRAEASLVELANVQLKVELLQSEIQLWCNMVESLPGVHSRDDVPHRFKELQRYQRQQQRRLSECSRWVWSLCPTKNVLDDP